MKKGISLLLLLTAALAAASSVPTEWKDRYQTLLKFITAKNVTGFKQMFAQEFMTTDSKGKSMNRAAFFKEVDALFADAAKVTGDIKVKNVKMRGGMAHVDFDLKLTIWQKDQRKVMIHEIGVDSWKKVGGRWLMVKTIDSVFKVTGP